MSIAALAQRLKRAKVPPVPSPTNPEGTKKTEPNQRGSLGSLGSLTKKDKANKPPGQTARLWLVTSASDDVITVSYTPPATLVKVRADNPGASIRPEQVPKQGRGLDPTDTATVTAWLDAIGETDTEARAQYLAICANDPHALEWTLVELASMTSTSSLSRGDVLTNP
ncbi:MULTISPECIES: hypothetical protein [Thiorhodovibrio]|uniref:hypothetical protein n=1 Tax=Thiorhodovibrio TaxID=61593 RepID=UPI0019123D23|nr:MULTISPECIES: hypothetical protein [Thiorhodovibrio]MBK5968786.1 hypothetical protein [Thiorhodovibrio winogradskyi]WPL12200.1 hypothetical protein Thiosp_01960 [Thiorhodovibrio litoralis]